MHKNIVPRPNLRVILVAMDKNKQLDFVAVGDITTDAFILLKDVTVEDADAHNHNNPMICMRFGDKIEYEEVIKSVKIERDTWKKDSDIKDKVVKKLKFHRVLLAIGIFIVTVLSLL